REPRAGPVLVHRLDLKVAHALQDRHAHDFLQERLGLAVAVQDRSLAAFFVVHDDLERETGSARPLRIRRRLAVADEIARVAASEGGFAPHPPRGGARRAPPGPPPPARFARATRPRRAACPPGA